MKFLTWLSLVCLPALLAGQNGYWQQHVEYKMEIDFDVNTHRFDGKQWLKYTNNSPDTIEQVFYHLYYNAFQPGSMMAERSKALADGDTRLSTRIHELTETEQGYHHIKSLMQDNANVRHSVNGTILEVQLAKPLLPGKSTMLEMVFASQVPVMIRRTGRDNAEGIAYSMAQWYPKLCEYDVDGWHPNPYIGREYYGVWGDFDVFLTIDKNFVVGGSGYLQNANVIGHGYEEPGTSVAPPRGNTLTWHFHAPNVHDFVWAADKDYTHTRRTAADGTELHFFFEANEHNKDNWAELPGIMDVALQFINKHCGKYPYHQYSFIQAGDGGMEYPMATLIRGNGSHTALVSVSVHEILHSWYQMILGTNESLYAWMDEGFTNYTQAVVMNELSRQGLLPGRAYRENLFESTYKSFANFSQSGYEESMITHADHFQSHSSYSVASYTKGSIFLNQLKYIIGDEAFNRTMLRYYNDWKFKHPTSDDFLRVAEKCSGMVLDWYKEYWVNSTHRIDYAIGSVDGDKGNTVVNLERIGVVPMPVEVRVTETNGKVTTFYAPLGLMRGAKKTPPGENWVVLDDWPWTNPSYTMEIPIKLKSIARIELDPNHGVCDINHENDQYIGTGKKNKS